MSQKLKKKKRIREDKKIFWVSGLGFLFFKVQFFDFLGLGF
jgi:hypothetical protein